VGWARGQDVVVLDVSPDRSSRGWRGARQFVLWALALQILAWLVGLYSAERLGRGDEHTDTFRKVTIGWGSRFESRAARLRHAAVVAVMGGVELDLRHAGLDPAGAVIDVNATMGGVVITVPAGWAVDIEERAVAGGVATTLAGADDIPAGAPSLQIRAVAIMGGIQVLTVDEERDPWKRPDGGTSVATLPR
jgi:hypothetical protein